MIDNSEQLRKIRKERRLTLLAVCDGAKIPIRTYQNYEYGKREISAEALIKLAKFYGVTTDYLLGLEPPPTDALEVLGIGKSVDDDEFIKLYNELPDYAKQIFVDTMAMLAQARADNKKKQSNKPRQPEPEEQPEIEAAQSAWRFTARRTDGIYESRPATPEEIEKLKQLEDDPEPEF